MSARIRDLKRFAATGIAAPGMTAHDKMKAAAMFGGGGGLSEQTITGEPPLFFRSDGSALTAWTVTGAAGGVGDQTVNLFDASKAMHNYYINDTDGSARVAANNDCSDYIPVKPETDYYITPIPSGRWGAWYDENKTFLSGITIYGKKTSPAGAKYMRVTVNRNNNNTDFANTFMVVEGATAPEEFVPYGFTLPLTCNGVTQTILMDAPLGARDTISMEDTGITITPAKGSNTLEIGTTTQPSAVSITGVIAPN